MVGYGNNLFKPQNDTTRATIIVMMWRLNGSPVVNCVLDFEDVKADDWYTEAVRWAKAEGIALGYGNGKLGPNDTMTREQLATMLWRYAGSPASSHSLEEFTDADRISGYAQEAMRWANEKGIVKGFGNGLLGTQGNTTRAQMVSMFMRFCSETAK